MKDLPLFFYFPGRSLFFPIDSLAKKGKFPRSLFLMGTYFSGPLRAPETDR